MAIHSGTRLGRYEIRSLLGSGGMGEVYLADDLTLHRQVAIKVLRADVISDQDRLRRFELEAFAASSLNHPNILTIHEIGHDGGYHFMVTEFIDGVSLSQRVKGQALQLHEILEIGIQVASALAAAHEAGIVHRDIKPDNIMLRRDHLLKVLDFGLAKLSDTNPTGGPEVSTKVIPLTIPGVVMGTVRYMSPEQARGLPVDARTDTWSLGVVLYEMVGGHLPFTGETMSDVIAAVLTAHPPLLATYRPDVPAELERIVTKSLRKNLEERYQMARDFGTDLKSLKQQLEFEAQLERSGGGQVSGPVKPAGSERKQTELTLIAPGLKARAASPLPAAAGAGVGADIDAVTRVTGETDLPRVTTPHEEIGSTPSAGRASSKIRSFTSLARNRWISIAVVGLVGVAALTAAITYWRLHKPVRLTEKDLIVLAEFINTTNDSVFDETLRQGLAAQLEQSPFLTLLPDERIAKTLALMERPKDTRLTQQLARDICRRTGSKATIEGSISGISAPYALSLKAVDCQTGKMLAEVRESAQQREHVLKATGSAATKLRTILGESLASVQKYDVPLENVTTGSLDALRAYSLGHRAATMSADYKGAVSFFEEAIRLDPNFAMAYARLASTSGWAGSGPSPENARKAYNLRERVSERERFFIESAYQNFVTENLEAARKIYETWMQLYPRDDVPPFNLANIYARLGEYDKVLHLKQESLKLEPGNPLNYLGVIAAYLSLNRFDEARATIEEARARGIDHPGFHVASYHLAFLAGDTAGMEREVSYLKSLPQSTFVLSYQSDTLAYSGQMSRARELAKREVEELKRAGKTEAASAGQAMAALGEALMGNLTLATREAEEAVKLLKAEDPEAKYIQSVCATVFGLAGDSAKATRLADDLEQRFPESTMMRFQYLPMVRGAAVMKSGNPTKAIEAFAVGERYEFGAGTSIRLYRIYLRGLAYLAARQGEQAAVEFQKILDHSGLMMNEPIGALAHLGLGRAYALAGDLSKARIAYQDFLALWKDADTDVPIWKEAQAEYGNLK